MFAVLPILASSLLFAMSSADAVVTLLNSKTACSAKTFETAKRIVERDAADGKKLQQFVIGVTTEDKELSRRYLDASRSAIQRMAEERGNPLAWYLLSMERNDFKCLIKAADGDNVQALNALGAIATQEAFARQGVTSNALERILLRSYNYFKRAAAKGDANGFVNLGTCYLRGFGCRQDMAQAFICFKAAADAGHPEGMDNVAASYQFGHGVKKDNDLCLYWTMRGRAARGDEAAANWLKEHR